jgi:hypothetical protein
VRKRLAIAGHAEEGLSLIPLLEANPDVEVFAILSEDREAVLSVLRHVEPGLDARFAQQVTNDPEAVLQTPGLVAIIDADPADVIQDILSEAPERGIQVTTPLIAKLLYAFGPVDATRKPDLLQTLGEILESYNLTVDRRGLLNRILQIAVGATGADRGSLMLVDPTDGCLTVDVAIGIEKELIQKIRIRPREGIAGRALHDRRAVLLKGKADRQKYNIARERDDVESAISAPLIHEEQVIGVLNLSHTREHGVFAEQDLDFVQQLARIDAKIIARAEEYHTLLRDSARLRASDDPGRARAVTSAPVEGLCSRRLRIEGWRLPSVPARPGSRRAHAACLVQRGGSAGLAHPASAGGRDPRLGGAIPQARRAIAANRPDPGLLRGAAAACARRISGSTLPGGH